MVTCQTCHMAKYRAEAMSMTWSQRNHPGDSITHPIGSQVLKQHIKPISSVEAGHGTERSFHMAGGALVKGMLQAARVVR